ncbi:succinoglycan biosynthesis protein exop [Komagataeibacter nataicola]|uniref:Succinoglycan biosynthesis protein exop n=1 Tax=Komagataeibacter nataicola TaxID=265960 RepID=A0A9N7CPN8_9PROT|nr:polysaccharide biosynthesis tyrosine autokinase [Komagataeibacter nataicola]AQU88459.1 succinoglycan biosynthesis protein exop [Komagataeibacter nataicola]PYD67154.1 succinoglycan biosynthesis protein exop [Komagataeibacter nataicola]WEQ54437.1 polysaccharide biosynthesis tyrosine autokinase [Komagataeibacter nataicola]GBR17328.1 protein-tyrosine kinase [Komagataeibacter nataicola NRIC 0616]
MSWTAQDVGLVIRQTCRAFLRHRMLFALTVLGVVGVGGAVTLSLKPRYTATATVVVAGHAQQDPLAPNGQQQNQAPPDDELVSTEAAMIHSRDVATAVLAQLPPPAQPAHVGLRDRLCHMGLGFLCHAAKPVDPQVQRMHEEDAFLNSLTITPEPRTQILDISVVDGDPVRAAALADAVVTNYQRIALARQTADINRVAAWLDSRTAALRQRWLDAVQKANAFDNAHGLTNTNEGSTSSPLIERQIADTASNLSQAQGRLAAAQARADALKDAAARGDARAAVALSQEPILVATANSLMQLESTRQEEAATYGPQHPRLRALDQQIATTKASLAAETQAALNTIREDQISARAEVDRLNENLDLLRQKAGGQSGPQAEYRTLDQEAQSARTVYETFLEHAKEVVDRAALLQPPIAMVSHASAPDVPSFPNRKKLGIGLFAVALAAGAGAVLLRDYFTAGFTEIERLRAAIPLPLLAVVPKVGGRSEQTVRRHVLDHPYSRATEAVRSLVMQLSMRVHEGGQPLCLAITSAGPEEGKSTLALWMAAVARRGGQKVLVIDADHRRGMLDHYLTDGTTGRPSLGMSDLVTSGARVADVIRTDPEAGFDYIPAGRTIEHAFSPVEIRRLRAMLVELKHSYELIIIDCPPLLGLSDALVHANMADQVIFVCRWKSTAQRAVMTCLERLEACGAHLAGVVATMVEDNAMDVMGYSYGNRDIRILSRFDEQ